MKKPEQNTNAPAIETSKPKKGETKPEAPMSDTTASSPAPATAPASDKDKPARKKRSEMTDAERKAHDLAKLNAKVKAMSSGAATPAECNAIGKRARSFHRAVETFGEAIGKLEGGDKSTAESAIALAKSLRNAAISEHLSAMQKRLEAGIDVDPMIKPLGLILDPKSNDWTFAPTARGDE